MKIALDSSALIESLTAGDGHQLQLLIRQGHWLFLPSITVYEWRRGPRTKAQLATEAQVFGPESILSFGEKEAAMAAKLYQSVGRARKKQADLAIAATAMANDCLLWTFNRADFTDLPGLRLLD